MLLSSFFPQHWTQLSAAHSKCLHSAIIQGVDLSSIYLHHPSSFPPPNSPSHFFILSLPCPPSLPPLLPFTPSPTPLHSLPYSPSLPPLLPYSLPLLPYSPPLPPFTPSPTPLHSLPYPPSLPPLLSSPTPPSPQPHLSHVKHGVRTERREKRDKVLQAQLLTKQRSQPADQL